MLEKSIEIGNNDNPKIFDPAKTLKSIKFRQSAWFYPWLIVLCAFMSLMACGKNDDTQAVLHLIRQGADFAQKHAVGDLMALTTPDFSAFPGERDTNEVKSILFWAFRYYRAFKIHYPRPSVQLEQGADRAGAVVYFVIVRQDQPFPELEKLVRDPDRWIEAAREKADLYHLRLDLTKSGDAWKVHKARLEGL